MNPGPESIPPACANHGWRTVEGPKRGVRTTVKRHGCATMDYYRARCWGSSGEMTTDTALACGYGEAGELSACGRETKWGGAVGSGARERCANEMGGWGRGPFNRAVRQLKGPLSAEES